MTPNMLERELEEAKVSALCSDQAVRELNKLLDSAQGAEATMTASDAGKIVNATLAVNERLHARLKTLEAEASHAVRPKVDLRQAVAARRSKSEPQ